MRRDWSTLLKGIESWRKRVQWLQSKLKALPRATRVVVVSVVLVAVFFATNLVYHVLHKPTEVFSPVSSGFNKTPIETWRRYAPLFREYSTASISPELLAALAQVESAGNPIANTYWRWRLTWNPYAVYQPASSGAGMYQMTDAALAEAQGYCILIIPSSRTVARRVRFILGLCRAAPSSLRRYSWTATLPRSSGIGEPSRSAGSGGRSWLR